MSAHSLKDRLSQPGLVIAPGVFDMVSLRLADTFGFDALYMTGFGTVASHMGLPDAGLATYADMVGRVSAMAGMARTPLSADGDTGYGGLLNVRHTVQGYEAAGAAAIQLEDQEFPKKCGHTPGRRVIPMEDMVRKIRVAADARRSKDFLIIARTDARTSLGLDEALRRAEAYAKAGADILFVEAVTGLDQVRALPQRLQAPQLINLVIGGKTPITDADELSRLGYGLVLYANAALQGAVAGMQRALGQLRTTRRIDEDPALVAPFAERQRLVNKPYWDELEQRYV